MDVKKFLQMTLAEALYSQFENSIELINLVMLTLKGDIWLGVFGIFCMFLHLLYNHFLTGANFAAA